MIRYVSYDEVTGRIKGRISVPNAAPLPEYRIELGQELTEQEWNLGPEMWWKVELATKQLIDLSDDELRAVRGLKPDAPLPVRPDNKMRGR